MAAGTAELHKAIVAAWNLSTTLRSGGAALDMDQPYVIFEVQANNDVQRMSSGTGDNGRTKRVDQDIPVEFRCYAQEAAQSAKYLAEQIAENIKKRFGGHPTTSPTMPILTLVNAGHLQTTLITEDDTEVDEGLHMWRLVYLFKLDAPQKF